MWLFLHFKIKKQIIPRFVGHIRKEAARLVNLIEDIIHLSQLDEGVEMPTETIDMLTMAEEATMKQIVELEDKTDRYEDALGTYLVKLSNMNLSVRDNRILQPSYFF